MQGRRGRVRRKYLVILVLAHIIGALVLFYGCKNNKKDSIIFRSSRAYKGHEGDVDMNRFVSVYPFVRGTRLDDCQTCHTGGDILFDTTVDPATPEQEWESFYSCNYCHFIPFPDSDIITGAPVTYEDTLNSYGLAYKNAGRKASSLRSIEDDDSDTDGHNNIVEIEDNRYPGDPDSYPGLPVAPIYTMTWSDITSATSHTQFLLLNAHKQPNDSYDLYTGAKVIDLLLDAGVDLTSATGVTFFAPDGYAKSFTMDEINNPFPASIYYANLDPDGFADPSHGFVTYPDDSLLPPGLVDTGPIPGEQWLIIAYERNGTGLEPGYLDAVSGKINGEGPYRNIVPQTTPGRPDRGSKVTPVGDGWDYLDSLDHNAGLCVKSTVAIRVDPMPAGLEEFDWKNGGWALVQDKKLIIYGQGVTGN
jgi:hypothetical protein